MGYTKSVHFCTFRDMRKVRNPVSARDPPSQLVPGFLGTPPEMGSSFLTPRNPLFWPFLTPLEAGKHPKFEAKRLVAKSKNP